MPARSTSPVTWLSSLAQKPAYAETAESAGERDCRLRDVAVASTTQARWSGWCCPRRTTSGALRRSSAIAVPGTTRWRRQRRWLIIEPPAGEAGRAVVLRVGDREYAATTAVVSAHGGRRGTAPQSSADPATRRCDRSRPARPGRRATGSSNWPTGLRSGPKIERAWRPWTCAYSEPQRRPAEAWGRYMIGGIATAKDASMSQTACETAWPIKSSLRTW